MRSQFGPTLPLLILDAAGSFAITIPLVGVLVRYRAHYSPKAVQLESEDGVQLEARTGPVIDGYFSTLKRVYKFEGWAGFYKGAVPELLTGGLLLVLLTIVPILLYGTDSPGTWPDKAKLEALGYPAMVAFSCATLLISLPITVLTYRIIVTPHKLSWLGLRQSLCTVLTPTERTRPWMLYQTPGLLVAQLLNAVVTPSLMVFQRFVLPDIPRSRGEIDFRFILQFSVYVILIILETSIVVPLQIISTRLALQRNHASQTHSQDGTNGIESVLPVYSAEEDVIGLRDENDPYTSFFDCLKRMISEEGVATLFRAWWITFIPVFAAGILDAGKKPNFHT